jgi:hypothetical protein
MGMFDEVLCNHQLFGVHKGETHQTKDLHWLGGALDMYEITPSGRFAYSGRCGHLIPFDVGT